MNKKYLVEFHETSPSRVDVTDLSPNSFDPKSLFDKDKVDFKNLSNSPFSSSPFSPPPQKESFPWGLLLLAALIAPIFSPDLREQINFDYSLSIYTPELRPNENILEPPQP